MAKSLKKYKKAPREAKKPVEVEVMPPKPVGVEELPQAMKKLGIAPKVAPVKKKRTRKPPQQSSIPGPPVEKHKTSDDESEGGVLYAADDSGVDVPMPTAAIPTPKKATAKVDPAVNSTTEDEGPKIPPETLKFMSRWIPKWNAYCHAFPQPSDFKGVAPYCSAGMDLVLAFTHDVTGSHIAKKGLPYDTSNPNAPPWEANYNNVFYPCDKIRNFIDINVLRFQKFVAGEEMEGRFWVDMDREYKKPVEALLEKVARLQAAGMWEKESRRVNEMIKYGVFGKEKVEEGEHDGGIDGEENGEDADDELEV